MYIQAYIGFGSRAALPTTSVSRLLYPPVPDDTAGPSHRSFVPLAESYFAPPHSGRRLVSLMTSLSLAQLVKTAFLGYLSRLRVLTLRCRNRLSATSSAGLTGFGVARTSSMSYGGHSRIILVDWIDLAEIRSPIPDRIFAT